MKIVSPLRPSPPVFTLLFSLLVPGLPGVLRPLAGAFGLSGVPAVEANQSWSQIFLSAAGLVVFLLALGLLLRRHVAQRTRVLRYQSQLLENASDAVISTDLNDRITAWNRAAETIYGWREAEVLGRELASVICPEYGDPSREEILHEFARQAHWQGEAIHHHRDGAVIYLIGSLGQLAGVDGRPVGLVMINHNITERKRAETALRKSEALLSQAQRIGRIGHIEWIAPDKEFTCSDEVFRIFELEPHGNRLQKSAVARMIFPADVARLSELDRKIFAERANQEYEYRILLPGGRLRWLHQQGQFTYAADGRPLRLIGIIQDITEQKLAQDALRDSEASLRKAQHFAGLGSWTWNIQTNRFDGSDELFAIFGMQRQTQIGNPLEVVIQSIHPDDREKILEANRQVLAGGPPTSLEYRTIMADGSEHVMWAGHGELLMDENGAPLMLSGTLQDITERKHTENELLKRASQLTLINDLGREIARLLDLQSVLDLAVRLVSEAFGYYHVALFVLDDEFNDLVLKASAGEFSDKFLDGQRVNPGEGMVGWAARHGKKLLANDVRSEPEYHGHPFELSRTRAELSLPIKVGEQVLGVLDLQSPVSPAFTDEDVSVLETLTDQIAVAIENGRLYQSMQNELAERKRAQAELLCHRDNLEELVRERTEQLLVAKEKAEAASQAKSAFLATMSHEIRTPLNGVLGLTYLALQTSLTSRQRDYLGKIQYSGESLLATINDILDFSKIEAGKFALEQADFSLEHVLHSVTSMLAYKAQENGLELTFETEPDVPCLLVGDALRLGQVLNNLVGNAIKFTTCGGVNVKIRRLAQEAADRPGWVRLEFSVRDTGIGLSDAQLAQLFQPFRQGDSSTSRKYGGTGLGLTISQRLVRMMGGEITVRSKPQQGSTFLFTLELAEQAGGSPADLPVVLQVGPSLSGAKYEDLRGRRVLLVEDNEINQLVALEMLRSLGLLVEVVSTGEEAIRRVKTGAFELVLMDIQMPGMDGYQATAEIRRDPRFGFQNLPVIAMTAHALVGDRERTLQAGLNDHISKPVDLVYLTGVLLRWLAPQTGGLRAVILAGALPAALDDSRDVLDVKGALVRLGDNQKFYQRLLLLFRAEHAGSVLALKTALQANDQDLALRLAHSLKGVAGAIGADMLAGAAKRLEAAIRGQQSALYADWLERTDEELAKVLAAIDAAVPEFLTAE